MVERIQQQPTVRERYAAELVAAGVLTQADDGRDRRDALGALRAAHDRLKAALADPHDRARRPPTKASIDATHGRGRRRQPFRPPGWRPSISSSLAYPTGSRSMPSSHATRAAARSASRRRDRLGPRRGARVRLPARGGDPDPPVGPGHRERHVLAPAPGAARRRTGETTHRSSTFRSERVARGLQLASLGVRGARLRIWLLHGGARLARALGGAVRRLRQRRADRRRPVHRRRAFEVGSDVTPHAPAASRLRRERPGAFERKARAIPAARRQENIRVANCTTAGQFFHLLRRQALDATRGRSS